MTLHSCVNQFVHHLPDHSETIEWLFCVLCKLSILNRPFATWIIQFRAPKYVGKSLYQNIYPIFTFKCNKTENWKKLPKYVIIFKTVKWLIMTLLMSKLYYTHVYLFLKILWLKLQHTELYIYWDNKQTGVTGDFVCILSQ
jgi:hypothetical protein